MQQKLERPFAQDSGNLPFYLQATPLEAITSLQIIAFIAFSIHGAQRSQIGNEKKSAIFDF